jgi:hypothetical protein
VCLFNIPLLTPNFGVLNKLDNYLDFVLKYLVTYSANRDSRVGVAIRYRLDGSGIESRWGKIFRIAQTDPEAHPVSCTMGTGSVPGGKVAGAWC